MAQTDIIIKLGGSTAKTIMGRASALDALANSVGRLKASFAGGKVLGNATSGMGSFTSEVKKAATATKKYQKTMKGASDRTDRFGTKIRGAGNALDNFRTLFARMVRIMSAFFIISTITRMVKGFIETIAQAPMQMELWNTQLVVLSGSATLAAQRLELLKTVAIETPLELPDLFQGLTTLQAFNVEISERTLPLITDLAAVSGRTFREVAEVVGKVIAGSPTAITRSLPTLAINPMEFKALAAELGSRSEALFQMIQERFEGFAKRSAKTVIGVISNIKDAYFVIMSDIGEGLMPAIGPAVQGLMDWLEALRGNARRLEEFRDKVLLVGDALVRVIEKMVALGRVINDVTSAVGGLNVAIKIMIGYLVGGALTRALLAWSKAAKEAQISMVALLARGFNPYIIVLGIVGGLIGYAVGQMQKQGNAARLAALKQAQFVEELKETNEQIAKNIMLVDAQIRKEQGHQFIRTGMGLLPETDVRPRDILFRTDKGAAIATAMDQAKAYGEAMNSPEIRAAYDAAFFALGEAVHGMGTEEAFEEALFKLKDAMVSQGKAMVEEAKKIAQSLTDLGGAAGEVTEDIEDLNKALDDFFAFWRDAFAASFGRQIDELKAKLLAGLITKEEAQEQAVALREQIMGVFRGLLLDPDPLMQQVAFFLEPYITNLDSFLNDFKEDITEHFENELVSIQVRLRLGIIDEESAMELLKALREKVIDRLKQAIEDSKPELISALNGLLSSLDSAIEKMEGVGVTLGEAMETALRQIVKQGSDALSELFGSLIVPKEGEKLENVVKTFFAGALDAMGNAMIQIGLASEVLQGLIETGFLSPVNAAAAIAIGIALKSMAAAMGNSVSNSMRGGTGGTATVATPSSITYPEYRPENYFQEGQSAYNVNIYAIDSQSFEQALVRNEDAFGRRIAAVARSDRQTGGQAYGAFVGTA